MNQRLQSDFSKAWNSTGRALEDLTILGLSLLVVSLFGLAVGVKNLQTWIVAQREWVIPGGKGDTQHV
jgi:hypothetical protein